MLEQNYRSTQTILDAANAVISNNEGRKPKKLWTALGKGEPIVGYAADNAQQEAQWVATEIARLHAEEDIAYSDMAIMYRANAQSRSLEEALINAGLPYQLVGGTKFYERREIKDALAYLQALVNPDDDVNLRRILNVPKRGLGNRAEGILLAYARERGTSFFYALMHLDEIQDVPTRTATQLKAFRDLMGELSQFTRAHDAKPSEIVAEVLEKSGLRAELEKSVDPQDASRLENLSQLQSTAAEFEQNTPDATLSAFLETTALVADSDQLPGEAEDSGKVTLMTLHTAKGLEYPVVFLTGMEQAHSRIRVRWRTPPNCRRNADLLCGYYPRQAAPVCHARSRTLPVGAGRRYDAQPVPRRDPRFAHRLETPRGRRGTHARQLGIRWIRRRLRRLG